MSFFICCAGVGLSMSWVGLALCGEIEMDASTYERNSVSFAMNGHLSLDYDLEICLKPGAQRENEPCKEGFVVCLMRYGNDRTDITDDAEFIKVLGGTEYRRCSDSEKWGRFSAFHIRTYWEHFIFEANKWDFRVDALTMAYARHKGNVSAEAEFSIYSTLDEGGCFVIPVGDIREGKIISDKGDKELAALPHAEHTHVPSTQKIPFSTKLVISGEESCHLTVKLRSEYLVTCVHEPVDVLLCDATGLQEPLHCEEDKDLGNHRPDFYIFPTPVDTSDDVPIGVIHSITTYMKHYQPHLIKAKCTQATNVDNCNLRYFRSRQTLVVFAEANTVEMVEHQVHCGGGGGRTYIYQTGVFDYKVNGVVRATKFFN